MTKVARLASTRNAGGILARRLVTEEPTTNELWGIERLEAHARHLGVDGGVGADLPPIDLQARLRANAERLESAYSAIVAALQQGRAITPAAEWLVDNYHVISEQVGDIPLRLTPSLWRSLPVTRHPEARGWPRIYLIASEYLKHSDYSFDTERFVSFLLSYQKIVPLTMRELWALYPIMRIALVDELRRLAVRVEAALDARGAADNLVNLLTTTDAAAVARIAEVERWTREPRYQGPFAVQLAQRLQQQGEQGQPLLQALTRMLLAQGTTIDRLTQVEHGKRSSSNLCVRNIMTSLRTLGSFDWRALFERTSGVELLLREQPSYRRCDRRTRDRYRSSIEDLATATGYDETRVAAGAVELLADAGGERKPAPVSRVAGMPSADAAADIGSVLIGWRRQELERALGAPPSRNQRLRRGLIRHASGIYAGAVITLTLALTSLALYAGLRVTAWPSVGVVMLAVMTLFPASELAIGLVNRQLMRRFAPRHLPRLALGEGLEPDMKTLVVIPVMLGSPADAQEAAQGLKVHALANPDPHVRYALLSDWRDAPTEELDDDKSILDAARAAIDALNADEPAAAGDEPRYYLFHRRRQRNAAERCYMGWERKRGKLAELNRVLLRQGVTNFVTGDDGQLPAPQNVRYVLTLDADTRLPIGAVRDLVGIAAHPLNRPVYSAAERRVVHGYGLLQPRITPTLPGVEERSLYREIVTSGSGIDPYAAAVSDVYQDVFGEGLFTGKGLYVLEAFEAAMADRVPENALLSHDLFEGLFARCALVSDIELFEDFPSHSEVAAARAHRWIRGDWQLLPWILGLRGPLPPLGRWKMLDNLRRSLLAPLSITLLITAFCVVAARPWVWLFVTLSPWLWPAFISAVQRLPMRPAVQSRRMHLKHLATELVEDLERGAVALGLLAQNAWLSLDAIGRALLRLTMTRRRLLEWVTAAQLKAQSSRALASFAWPLKGASIIVIAATGSIVWFNPVALPGATPLLLLWWLSPLLAQYLSTPRADNLPDTQISEAAIDGLRRTARLTWRFFERFVTPEDNALPPDNFQETPRPVVAHRSSPTNFGLYLLAVTAARDFGWLGVTDLVQRLVATLDTMDRLERCNGHFFNWYETRTLAPLQPRYVSTVDSGNLAGHLQTLAQGALQITAAPLLHARALAGPLDALDLADLSLQPLLELAPGRPGDIVELQAALQTLRDGLQQPVATLVDARNRLIAAVLEVGKLEDMVRALATDHPSQYAALAGHLQMLRGDLATHSRDLAVLLPAAPATLPAAARAEWEAYFAALPRDSSLPQLQAALLRATDTAQSWSTAQWTPMQRDVCTGLLEATRNAGALARRLQDELAGVRQRCDRLVHEMNFRFLFDRVRGLFSIGYRPSDHTLDSSYYDLLASEARLTSFIAIAKGDVSRSHWFKLGRRLTGGSRQSVLASWSGSMFEYLMPSLVMREPRGSLLDQTSHRIVAHQVAYGAEHQLPWGVSESAYNVRDRDLTYQYSGFGLPSLGLKRGLGADYVIAPYATALASMYQPDVAQRNFLDLANFGGLGDFGYYESIDFTPARVPTGSRGAVVRAYFAHHQGMSLVALDNALHDHIMQRRFHADPVIKAAELLLQERGVRFADAPVLIEADIPQSPSQDAVELELDREVHGIAAATPVTHLLSNRNYSVLVTDSGAGYSRCGPRAVTRWREDATQDCWGSFIYLRDIASGDYWSAGFQPTAAPPDDYEAVFREERVTLSRRDGTLSTVLDIVVSTEDDGELRRVTLRNEGSRDRSIEITSYAEIVMAPQRADLAHPGFSNLFVRTEFLPELGCLLAVRRPRSSVESPVWAVHLLCGAPGDTGHVEYETDRQRFIGRGRNLRAPLVIDEARPLSNTVGSVLDPIFSLRKRVSVPASGVATLTFATLVATSRAQALELASKYRNPSIFAHVVDVAWTFARAELHHLQTTLEESRLFQVLAGHLVFASRQLRAGDDVIAANRLDVTHLWRFAISGDRPIVVVRCQGAEDMGFVRQCLRAQEYLRIKQLAIDVVVLNDQRHSYIQDLQDAIEHTLRAVQLLAQAGEPGERGSAFALRADALSPAELTLVLATARAVLEPAQGSLAEQLLRPPVTASPALRQPSPARSPAPLATAPTQLLEFFNGMGGFAEDGREYGIVLEPGRNTPAPWSNVLANEQFGSLVTESGSMCTWSMNSRENQLTPWSNDAVSDPSGEAFYLHEPQTGALWSPTPLPLRLPDARYDVRHGQGYSRFALEAEGIASELTVLVAAEDPVKLCRLRLTNRSTKERRLTIASYVEWTLGAARAGSAQNIVTAIDGNGAMLASNPVQVDFGTRVAFCDLGGLQRYWTGSRHEFLGRNGSAQAPAGIFDVGNWTGRVGAGLDPCCAFAMDVQLAAGESQEVVLVLGQAATVEEARRLVAAYRDTPFETAYRLVVDKWESLLGAVRIRTPDRALDILCNRWLLYQTISCRLWGRAGFYQAGGAFGFRDQLQDGMALSVIAPRIPRAHLLRAAARQFVEGDAQHWWHPPSGRGVRTHFSDDRIWLPFATAQYVETTADLAVLDESVPFITGPPLPLEQEDSHYTPEVTTEQASLYEHCARALDVSLRTGSHGLPLMGGGDWNDGMNRVGHEGRGESVWLAWFLIATLRQFIRIARQRGDHARVLSWTASCDALLAACEAEAWDGAWYRRAYFDDGTPLGSASNAECRIDSLAQSWAVLSGAADPARAAQAMNSVEQYLVRAEDGLVLLFTPPFDASPLDPGYIKGYLPGLRENGGQYTHAAVWVLMAQARLKDHAQVASLLDMLNPIRRSDSRSGVQAYRVEPYVLAADVYAGSAYARRGGWTWYTGAAGWMHRAIIESVLGLRIKGDQLSIDPCLPPHWNDFEAELNVDSLHYVVRVERVRLLADVVTELDGVVCAAEAVPLLKDGRRHLVRSTLL